MTTVDKEIREKTRREAESLIAFFANLPLPISDAPEDISLEALHQVDSVIYQLWGEAGPTLAVEAMVNMWGGYLGCALRENFKSEWINVEGKAPALELKGNSKIVVHPYSMMYKRLVNGSLDSLAPKLDQIEKAYYGT